MNTSFDAIVIGAGQAGPSLAVRLAASGLKTALVEREHLGGRSEERRGGKECA